MKVRITDIKWDIDNDEMVEAAGENPSLPDIVEKEIGDIYPSLEDDISEWLSNEYGYCHNGFRYDFILSDSDIKKANVQKARQVLIDNGIEADEANTVLQAIGYTLLNVELESLMED